MSQGKVPSGHLSNIIEERITEWNMRREKGLDHDYRHVVTVSREIASGGILIAEKVAQKLGMAFWNKDLVQAVTENSGLCESMVSSLDQKAKSALEDIADAIIFGQNATNRGYIQQLCRVFRTIEEHGSAVLLGRGAQFVMRRKALKVRIIAPFELRAERLAERKNLGVEEARGLMKQIDEERKNYYLENYQADLSDSHHYDLTLNVENFDVEEASDLVVSCYKAKFQTEK